MRKILSLLLAISMLFSFTVIVNAETQQEDASVGTVVEFGSYPQTQVTDEALVAELDAATPEEEAYFKDYWCKTQPRGSSAYCSENEHMMSYKDVTYNNEKYRGIKINSYRPLNTECDSSADFTHQDENGYEKEIWYWFKYEPIEWVIFDTDRMYAISKVSIDAQPFNNEYLYDSGMFMPKEAANGLRYANEFSYCHLKNYLRDVFMPMAFSVEEQEQLEEINVEAKPLENFSGEADYMSRRAVACTKVVIPTYEQVFGSEKEMTYRLGATYNVCVVKDVFMNSVYTDYYKVQGGDCNYSFASWWLATPDSYSGGRAKTVTDTNEITSYSVTALMGVRPVICLKNVLDETETETQQDNGVSNFFAKGSEKESSPAIAEGECNEDISWALSESGILTISGKGEMPEWDDSEGNMPPWYYECREEIKNVVIEDKITSVGKLAFYGCPNLQSVTIPDSVTYIGECAFDDCDSFTEINYGSDADDWAKIEIEDDNIDFSEITVNYTEKSSVPVIIGAVGGVAVVGAATGIAIKKRKKSL